MGELFCDVFVGNGDGRMFVGLSSFVGMEVGLDVFAHETTRRDKDKNNTTEAILFILFQPFLNWSKAVPGG